MPLVDQLRSRKTYFCQTFQTLVTFKSALIRKYSRERHVKTVFLQSFRGNPQEKMSLR